MSFAKYTLNVAHSLILPRFMERIRNIWVIFLQKNTNKRRNFINGN